MPNLPRTNNPYPMPFFCKSIKNNKGVKGNDTKFCRLTHKLSIILLSYKSRMSNFTLNHSSCMVKKVTLVAMFATTAPSKMLESL